MANAGKQCFISFTSFFITLSNILFDNNNEYSNIIDVNTKVLIPMAVSSLFALLIRHGLMGPMSCLVKVRFIGFGIVLDS